MIRVSLANHASQASKEAREAIDAGELARAGVRFDDAAMAWGLLAKVMVAHDTPSHDGTLSNVITCRNMAQADSDSVWNKVTENAKTARDQLTV